MAVSKGNNAALWMARAIICVGSLGLAYMAASFSLSTAAQAGQPDYAMRVSASNAAALTLHADNLMARDGEKSDSAVIARLARASLALEAANPRALRQLAFHWSKHGKKAQSERLLDLANQVTRRDFGVQAWLIESAVASESVPKALMNYDVALRTNRQGWDVLFPIVTNALSDEEVQNHFVPYIRSRPPWLHSFLNHAIENSANPATIAATVQKAGGMPQTPEFDGLEATLLMRILQKSELEDVKRYAMSLRGINASSLREIAFTTRNIDKARGPISYFDVASEQVAGSFVASKEGAQILNGSAIPSAKGQIVAKLIFLEQGNYQIGAKADFEKSNSAQGSARIEVNCLTKGASVTVKNMAWKASADGTTQSFPFQIPAGCGAQYLIIILENESGTSDLNVAFSDLTLRKGN